MNSFRSPSLFTFCKFLCGLCLYFCFLFPQAGFADCTLQVQWTGTASASSLDLLQRASKRAKKLNCSSILLLINTPGGSLQSTRKMVQHILQSSIPFLCFVYPQGAHAGSAGAILLQACHIVGAMPATNLGAATPVTLNPTSKPSSTSKAMEKKILNDTISWVEGLAKLRGRNRAFARDIVEKAKAVDAHTAKELGAIDTVASSPEAF